MNQDCDFILKADNDFCSVKNPLDFLLHDTSGTLKIKRTPRSSFESSDRQLEIPICDPPYIRPREDSDRSRRSGLFFEPLPGQLSPCKKHKFKLDSLMATDTFGDGDFLMEQRERLPSDTCMTSSEQRASSDSNFMQLFNFDSFEPVNEVSLHLTDQSLSDTLINDAASGKKDTSSLLLNEDESQQEIYPENPSAAASDEQFDNQIDEMEPMSVHESDESSALTAEKEAKSVLVSREGRRV